MKSCPICRREYVDDMRFCLEDGAPLTDRPPVKDTETVTEEYGAETQIRQQSGAPPTVANKAVSHRTGRGRSNAGIFILIAFVFAGIVILLGAGLAGFWWYKSKQTQLSVSDKASSPNLPPDTNRNAANSNEPLIVIPNPSNRSPSPLPLASVPKMTPTPSKTVDGPVPTPPLVPKTLSGGVLNGKATSLPRPPYPPAARAVRATGSVSVQVLVDERGNVVSASAVSGHPLLRAAAVAAAREAKFSPTILSGQAVKVSGVVTYNFEL